MPTPVPKLVANASLEVGRGKGEGSKPLHPCFWTGHGVGVKCNIVKKELVLKVQLALAYFHLSILLFSHLTLSNQ